MARSLAGSLGLLDERDDPSRRVQLGDPAGPGVGRAEQDHGERVAVRAVEREQRPQVDVAEVIGVDDDDLDRRRRPGRRWRRSVPAEPRSSGSYDSARRSRPSALTAIDVGPDLIGVGVRVDPGLADARLGQAIDPEVQQRTAGDRDQALGDRVGQGAEPGPQPARQEEGLDSGL